MDLLKYIIVGIGCILLGIIVAFIAHSIWAGMGIMVLLFFGYILLSLVKGINPVNTSNDNINPAPQAKKDN